MIRIVLVDDDVLALTMLKRLIDLNGARIVGEFTQPEQALHYVLREPVDILITDMRMPKIDGIRLIRQVKEAKPETQVICISSYEDFYYVKESFKEGSIDYILKHALNEESMTRALTEAIAKLHRIRKPAEPALADERVVEEGRRALKSNIVTQLLREEVTAEAAAARLGELGIELNVGHSILVLCEIDGYAELSERFNEKDKRIFLQAVTDLFERILQKVPEKEIIRMDESRYTLILSFPHVRSRMFIYNAAHEYSRRLNENLARMLNVKLSIAIGECCMKAEDLVRSYRQCEALLSQKLFAGKGRVYDAVQRQAASREERTEPESEPVPEAAAIQTMLSQGDDAYADELRRLFRRWKSGQFPIAHIYRQLFHLLHAGIHVIRHYQLPLESEAHQFDQLYEKLKKQETLDDMERIVLQFCEDIARAVKARKAMLDRRYNKYTVKAIESIERHYRRPISLQDIAADLRVHPTYLSKVFKNDTQLTFTEYLNRYRIEKAIELIRTQQYTIKEIYGRVGFNQYTYFFKVFRQVTGVTPSEYESAAE
jgi:two-component system response regulator YesN